MGIKKAVDHPRLKKKPWAARSAHGSIPFIFGQELCRQTLLKKPKKLKKKPSILPAEFFIITNALVPGVVVQI